MKNILVLCTGNSARSILGEALLEHLGKGLIQSFSAGSNPKGKVHPASIKLLKSKGFETDKYHSKSWDVFSEKDAPMMDVVITVCDSAGNETCPVWIGAPVQTHWGISDPANIKGEGQDQAFLLAYEQIKERITKLISLPLEEMDTPSLKRALDEIGAASAGATAMAIKGAVK